jgi:hypothetical protein
MTPSTGDPRPLRPPGNRHALPNRCPVHQRAPAGPRPPAPWGTTGPSAEQSGTPLPHRPTRRCGSGRLNFAAYSPERASAEDPVLWVSKQRPERTWSNTDRRLGARYQELIAPLVNPTTADQPGAR